MHIRLRNLLPLASLFLTLVLPFLTMPLPTQAGPKWGPFEYPLPGLQNMTIDQFVAGGNPLTRFIAILANLFLVSIVAVGLLMMVIGGYFYMTAGGNAKQVDTGKEIMRSALLGISIALLSFVLLQIIGPQFTPKADPKLL